MRQRQTGSAPRLPAAAAAEAERAAVTDWICRWQAGDAEALEQFLPLVYDQLRLVARAELRRHPAELTLQTTALVHELMLRLLPGSARIQNSKHLFATAAKAMRQILLDRARARRRDKRGGDATRVALTELAGLPLAEDVDIEALSEAMDVLAHLDPQAVELLELRFFVGLTMRDIALLQDRDERTVYRDFAFARAWLAQRLR